MSGTPVTVRGDGEDVRDYIYIDDVVQVCLSILTTESKEIVFNIGCGSGASLLNVIHEFENNLNTKLNVVHQECRASDIPVSVLGVDKTKELLNFQPSISLADGLRMFLKFHGIIE